ncbi:MAG: site-specific DNA-methyltransferase [Armatimonadetes bacterium]|nr:site-specific DNA-methyltransferase [Armatimonadota bacterium]
MRSVLTPCPVSETVNRRARAGESKRPLDPTADTIVLGDNLEALARLPDGTFSLVYIDPPFNTGRQQTRVSIQTVRDEENGDRIGFGGNRYRTETLGVKAYPDLHDDYLGFLEPVLREARRVLTPDGSLFFHIDFREAHYCKVLLDELFGRDSFMNEIIWAYDYGGRSKRKWPAKHDTIFWYAKNPNQYLFNYDDIDRIPYMAPGLAGPEKAARGKTPTDVWWMTIVSPTGKEKTGYPTQKPLALLKRIVSVHSNPGDCVLDFFAGSGTTGEAAAKLGRTFFLIDNNEDAFEVMRGRLAGFSPLVISLTDRDRRPADSVRW